MWYFYLLGAIALLVAIILVIVVILQEGNSQGVGVVSGGADTFFSKNKARSIDAFLARWTKFIAVGFFVLVLAINVVAFFTNEAPTSPVTPSITASADEATK
ncbi:MAG: preprotein translocase subunit SecG [Clostridia bacterium]|nr:preprotein translocase subunit SecG [Clostridia bacterium]